MVYLNCHQQHQNNQEEQRQPTHQPKHKRTRFYIHTYIKLIFNTPAKPPRKQHQTNTTQKTTPNKQHPENNTKHIKQPENIII